MEEDDILMEIYKSKHSERINYVDHWIKTLQIFITVAMAFIGSAVYSGKYILLVILPFLVFLWYLIQAVFVWIIFLTDEISFRAICAINNNLNADLFSTKKSSLGPLKDLDIYASTEYEKMYIKKYIGNVGNAVVMTVYIICSIFGIIYTYGYLSKSYTIALILFFMYSFCLILMVISAYLIEEDKRKRREKNYDFLNSKRPCNILRSEDK